MPVRLTTSSTVPSSPVGLTAGASNCTSECRFAISTVAADVAPSTAPPFGPERVTVNAAPSAADMFPISETVNVLLVSPAAKERVPLAAG